MANSIFSYMIVTMAANS